MRCKAPLQYDPRKSLQVGVAAQWVVCCSNTKCHAVPMLLHTSQADVAPFQDEPKLNRLVHFASITCAVNFTRLNDMLRTIGAGKLSVRGHWRVKEELEGPAAHAAQAAMAAAYQQELARPAPALPRTLKIDGSWDHGRLGNTAIMPFMADSGHIVHLEHARRTEAGVKSSNALEMLCFRKGLANPRVASDFFPSITMDGCHALVTATEAANKSAEGDGWHHVKARAKGFRSHCEAFVSRPQPTPRELEAKHAVKVTKPATPSGAPTLTLPKVTTPVREELEAALRAAGAAAAAGDDEKTLEKAYVALMGMPPAKAALQALVPKEPEGEETELDRNRRAMVGDIASKALAAATATPQESLKLVTRAFRDAAAVSSVATADELAAWKKYIAFSELQECAAADRSRRTSQKKDISADIKTAVAWELVAREMYNYVFAYTASLCGKINEVTQQPWTKEERTMEAIKLYPDAFLHLAAGIYDAPSLLKIAHPATKQKGQPWSWSPPGEGCVKPGSTVWQILAGWVRDPQSLARFGYYINNRSTAGVESFAGKVHKWNEKRYHYTRYYMLGVHFAILDHEDNVEREILHVQWKRGEALRHKGRWYQKKARAPTTDLWRPKLWADYNKSLEVRSGLELERSYLVDAAGATEALRRKTIQVPVPVAVPATERVEPPERTSATTGGAAEAMEDVPAAASEAATAASAAAMLLQRLGPAAEEETRLALAELTPEAIQKMNLKLLQEKLRVLGLDTAGKKAVLQERLTELLEAQATPQALDGDDVFEAGEQDPDADAGADGSGDGHEGGGAGAVRGPVVVDATTACLLMGVKPEWFEVNCLNCGAVVLARLPLPMTRVECACCKFRMAVHNTKAKQPEPLSGRKRRGAPMWRCQFMSEELKKIAKEQPGLPSKQRFAEASANLKALPASSAAALAAAASTAAPKPPTPATIVNPGMVTAVPVDGSQTLVKTGVTVLGLQAEVRAMIPPPSVTLPKAERPKKASHKRRAKSLRTEDARRKQQRRRPMTPP